MRELEPHPSPTESEPAREPDPHAICLHVKFSCCREPCSEKEPALDRPPTVTREHFLEEGRNKRCRRTGELEAEGW